MRFVRLGFGYFAVVDIAGKSLPRVFPDDTPFAQQVSPRSYLQYQIQARVDDQNVAVWSWAHAVEIVEARKRYILEKFDAGPVVSDYFRRNTHIQLSICHSPPLHH